MLYGFSAVSPCSAASLVYSLGQNVHAMLPDVRCTESDICMVTAFLTTAQVSFECMHTDQHGLSGHVCMRSAFVGSKRVALLHPFTSPHHITALLCWSELGGRATGLQLGRNPSALFGQLQYQSSRESGYQPY